MSFEEHGFILTGVKVGDHMKPVARFVCACGNYTDVSNGANERLNPTALVNTARRRGWEAEAYRTNTARCPGCIKRTPKRNDTDSELKKFEAKQMATLKASGAPAVIPTEVVALRDPTPDQRAMIRKLLEAHFDEDEGYYVPDYSDERIAAECMVPRLVVERLREAAYGPIRISAEMLAHRKELAELKKKIEETAAKIDRLTADQNDLVVLYTALEGKLLGPAERVA